MIRLCRHPACVVLAVVGLFLWGASVSPVRATSATAGLQPENEDGPSIPAGRLPGQAVSASSKPVPAPPFRLTPPTPPQVAGAGVFKPETFTLPNGLAVVVIPNHRAPIVSHMVWYQVGAADEPVGKSGLAHLLEHLMFKGTPTVPDVCSRARSRRMAETTTRSQAGTTRPTSRILPATVWNLSCGWKRIAWRT